ncbi:uncharacterized protein LOC110181933 [Drosophila serrata]|uniref:uncharacterized protein LOC110181933 n=1 Tax=Drosophila serrata TaxID=7274 RepID=UPI000A1D2EBC|nr:uncharacterized protein LOC110181933 [Drosophila serrata]
MANTFRVNWFKKLLNSCTPTRKYRHMDDSHQISSTLDIRCSRKVQAFPEQAHSTTLRPARFHKCPTATAVRIHPVIRNLNSSNKQKRNLSMASPKRRKDVQLSKNLATQSGSLHSKTIPIKMVAMRKQETPHSSHRRMGWEDIRDLVVTKNIEKILRESKLTPLQRRRKKNLVAKCSQKCKGKNKPVKGLPTKAIGLSQKKHLGMDVKFSRLQSKLEYNAKRSVSSRSSDNHNHDGNTPVRDAYRMRIAQLKFRFLHKRNPRTKTKQSIQTFKPSRQPNPVGFRLMQDEQKRLDVLKAEWIQLMGLQNAARQKRKIAAKELIKKKLKETVEIPIDTAINTLIVDPKSFLNKVHVQNKILSVDYDGTSSDDPPTELDKPNGLPDPTKSCGFGESDVGLEPN